MSKRHLNQKQTVQGFPSKTNRSVIELEPAEVIPKALTQSLRALAHRFHLEQVRAVGVEVGHDGEQMLAKTVLAQRAHRHLPHPGTTLLRSRIEGAKCSRSTSSLSVPWLPATSRQAGCPWQRATSGFAPSWLQTGRPGARPKDAARIGPQPVGWKEMIPKLDLF